MRALYGDRERLDERQDLGFVVQTAEDLRLVGLLSAVESWETATAG
jgi:hypothetical protein